MRPNPAPFSASAPADPGVPRTSSTGDEHLVEADSYRLSIDARSAHVRLHAADGRPLGRLALLASVDTADGVDGTTAIGTIEPVGGPPGEARFAIGVASTHWRRKQLVLACTPTEVRIRVEVEGRGSLGDVRLLAGYAPRIGTAGSGLHRSQLHAWTMVSPNPEDPHEIAMDARRPATIGVVGGGGPGRGHWFFTPAPLAFAFSSSPLTGSAVVPSGPWTIVGLAGSVHELTFTDLLYEPLDTGFGLRLAYEGQTRVDGSWASPWVVIAPGATDPYAGFAAYARGLVERGFAPAPSHRLAPEWWREPIFCGWGAQCDRARRLGGRAADHATQAAYDGFLAELSARDIEPGTVVVDDRWQRAYGLPEPDDARWPDLPGWIAERHREGRRVLLWWKAWDPSGLPPELCVTTRDGEPIAADPSNPAYRAHLGSAIERLVAPPPGGLGADGLKIDFTASTPSGPGLVRAGPEWGIALLHRLLATIHDAAKSVRPDALVVAHAPNPAFADVADVVRLNDVLRLADPDRDVPVVAQMRHRAAVARAAVPGLLIETDDWAMPSRAAWRAYVEAKGSLGIPSLYFTTHLDVTGEALTDDDAAAVRRTWAAYRAANGLAQRPAATEDVA